MPTTILSSEYRPTFVEKPDIRFATTFLSSEYRDYSVEGEAIMDKSSGELFLKRPIDGRVISFHQNKKYMYDLMLQLRILLTNNEDFYYPMDNIGAYYVSTDYDLVSIHDEHLIDILDEDTIIPNSEDSPLHQLKFNISNQVNGFFCRPMSRDVDKAVLEYTTNQYNKFIESYVGTDSEILEHKQKYEGSETWKDSNVELSFTLTISDAFVTKTYNMVYYVRFNEEMCVYFPMSQINQDFPYGYNSISVKINSLKYTKLHFTLLHKDLMDSDFDECMNKFLAPDKRIQINYLNILSFVNSSTDIELLGNENIIALLDVPYIRRYMMKMSKIRTNSSFIQSTLRPSEEEWTTNTVWAEHVRDIYKNGEVVYRGSETDIRRMEAYLSNTKKYQFSDVVLVRDENDSENFLEIEVEGGK